MRKIWIIDPSSNKMYADDDLLSAESKEGLQQIAGSELVPDTYAAMEIVFVPNSQFIVSDPTPSYRITRLSKQIEKKGTKYEV